MFFIIMVTWLVAIAGKIKGRGFYSPFFLYLSPELSLSFTLPESHYNYYRVRILLFAKERMIC